MFFKFIISLFKKIFFILPENEDSEHSHLETQKIINTSEKAILKKDLPKSITKKETALKNNSTTKKQYDINKLNFKIKQNIFFLTELSNKLAHFPEYEKHYLMINDLKTQSEGCLRILYRLKPEKIGFESTVKMIVRHTNEVAKIMDES